MSLINDLQDLGAVPYSAQIIVSDCKLYVFDDEGNHLTTYHLDELSRWGAGCQEVRKNHDFLYSLTAGALLKDKIRKGISARHFQNR